MKHYLIITCQNEECGSEQVTRMSEEYGSLWPVKDLNEDACPECGSEDLAETIEREDR